MAPERKKTAAFAVGMTEAERAEIDSAIAYDQGAWARGVLLREARKVLKKEASQ